MPFRRRSAARRRQARAVLLLVAVLALPAVAGAQPRPVGLPLPVDPRDGEQTAPAVAVAADGGFVVAWLHRGQALYARSFGPDGASRSPVLLLDDQVALAFRHTAAEVAVDAAGRFVVVWEAARQPGPLAVFVRRFAADGSPLGPRALVHSASDIHRFGAVLAMAPTGEHVIGWTAGLPQGGHAVFARRYDAEGRGGAVVPITPGSKVHIVEDVALDAAGRALFVLAHYPDFALRDLDVRAWDPEAGQLGGLVRLTTTDDGSLSELESQATARAGDGFQVTWVRWSPVDPLARGVFARRVSAAGVPVGPAMHLVEAFVTQARQAPIDGGFLLAWVQVENGTFAGFTRSFDDAGGTLGPVEPFPTPAWSRTLVRIELGSHPTGGVVAAWMSEGQRVLATRFADDCLDPAALCLLDRFRVEVGWAVPAGGAGAGVPVPRDDTWGTFWFFHPDNVELAVKTVDACALDGRVWLFFGSLTDVEMTIVVVDTVLGDRRVYRNPPGTFASRGDTAAFRALPPPGGACGGAVSASAAQAPAAVAVAGLLRLPVAAPLAPATPCAPDATTLCLDGDRFAAGVEWRDFSGNRGPGRPLPLSRDSGAFWFFRPDNPELFVKVLDGTAVNGHHWVFYGALTNVEFELTVRDTAAGSAALYHNPLGHFASRGDTTALP